MSDSKKDDSETLLRYEILEETHEREPSLVG